MPFSRLLFIVLLLSTAPAHAQPSQTFLGSAEKDIIAQLIPSPDGNYFAAGSRSVNGVGAAWLLKLDPVGQVLWEKTYSGTLPGFHAYIHGIVLLPDGNLLLMGEQRSGNVFEAGTALAIKTSPSGNVLWTQSYANASALFDATPQGSGFLMVGWYDNIGSTSSGIVLAVNANGIVQTETEVNVYSQARIRRIFPTNDGKFILIGRSNVVGAGFQGLFLRKIEPDGSQIWQHTFNTDFRERDNFGNENAFYSQPLGAVEDVDGSFWVTNPKGSNSDILFMHFSGEGMLIEQKTYGSASLNERPYALISLPDGGWLIAGESYNPNNSQGFACKMDANGLEIWRQYYGTDNASDRLFSAAVLPEGGFLLAGASNQIDNGANGGFDGWLLHTEADGNILPWNIKGSLILDLNNNCQADPGEPPLSGWFVEASDTATRLLITDPNGQFSLHTDDANILLNVLNSEPADSWVICNNGQNVVSDANNPNANLVFLVQSTDGDCPHTEVSITQPDLLRCQSSRYFVTVRNRGTGASGDLLLNVALDPALELEEASEFFVAGAENSFDFIVPPLGGLQEKIISLRVRLSCDVQLGATHAVMTRISPTECAQAWSGPHFTVQGVCTSDEVVFSLNNDGDESATTRYRVLADGLLASDYNTIELPADATAQTLNFPADGRTWRVELEQANGYPTESQPSATVEGCGTGSNGLYSVTFRNAWRFDESAPDVAAALAPNSTGLSNKIAEATHGYGFYNLIADSSALEFTARIRNPLNIPATSVEFRLLLSSNLDPSSFQALSANSQPIVSLDNTGVLRVLLTGLQLDTGFSADAYAFLRFRIRPLPGTAADQAENSLFEANAVAYVGGTGPYLLASGFLNFSKTFPLLVDEYNNYPPEILRFGGRSYDFMNCMAQASDGSVFLAGESSSYSDRTHNDGLLIKTNHSGRAYWLNAYDLGDQGKNTFRGIAPLPDGGCLAAGNYFPPVLDTNGLIRRFGYVARVDSSGRMIWHQKIHPAGSQYDVWISGMIATQCGGAVLFGYTDNENGQDHFYLKLNADGQMIWQHYEFILGSAFRPYKAIELSDGSMVFMGSNTSTVIDADIYLEKIDTSGNILWSKGYNSQNGIILDPGGLTQKADGDLIVSGYSQWLAPSGDYVTTPTYVDFSPLGDFQWEKNPIVGSLGYTRLSNTIAAPDGSLYSVGEILVDNSDRFYDIFLLKLDTYADTIWSRNYGSKNTEWAVDALITTQEQILLLGFNQQRPPEWNLQSLLIRADLNGNLSLNVQPEPPNPTNNIQVFPNPSAHHVSVSLPITAKLPLQWQLCNVSGQVMKTGETTTPLFMLDVNNLAAGVYVLHFPGQQLGAQRVVVLH